MRQASAQQPHMRDRILEQAEQLFRAYGYGKTTVADIASACGMSPANVYRFFESKTAIHETLTGVILQRMEALAHNIASERSSAAERLRKLLLESHRLTCEQYLKDSKVHEICTKAMAEQWSVIDAHCMRLRAIFQQLVEDGVESGEFEPCDVEAQAHCVFNGSIPFCHPQIVAERFVEDQGRQAALMAEFMIRSLSVRKSPDKPPRR